MVTAGSADLRQRSTARNTFSLVEGYRNPIRPEARATTPDWVGTAVSKCEEALRSSSTWAAALYSKAEWVLRSGAWAWVVVVLCYSSGPIQDLEKQE